MSDRDEEGPAELAGEACERALAGEALHLSTGRSLSNGRRLLRPLPWQTATLALLVAGWVTFILTREYVSRLEEQYGPAPDVVDALKRDAYVGRRALPYFSVAVLLDVLAALTLAARGRP